MSTAGSERLRQLLDAIAAIGAGLDLEETLERITQVAADLIDAKYGAMGVLDDARERIVEFITVGVDRETRRMIGHPPEGHGLLGAVIVDQRPIRVTELAAHPDSYGFPANHPPMKSFLGVPVSAGDEVFGNLYLTDKRSGGDFTDVDEEILTGLAVAAGIAIENARLHERASSLALAQDRERIARDLHDTVIHRLFAVGLSLQGTLPLLARDRAQAAERIETAIDDLDVTVRRIRTAIFELDTTRATTAGVRSRVLESCRDAAESLGFEPRVTLDGPIDAVTGSDVADDLVASVQEALSNVARHARATEVEVTVSVDLGYLTLVVADDGVGPGGAPETASGKGLRNIAQRAERHRGGFEFLSRPDGGSVLRWVVSTGGADDV